MSEGVMDGAAGENKTMNWHKQNETNENESGWDEADERNTSESNPGNRVMDCISKCA